MCMCMCACVVVVVVFRGKILGYVRRRTTTEPFTKDVVIDHERWKHALSMMYAACVELDTRPNSLRSSILRCTVSLEKGGV